MLKKLKISKKSLRKEATERSYKCRYNFKLIISAITYDIIIYLDKSSTSEYTAY